MLYANYISIKLEGYRKRKKKKVVLLEEEEKGFFTDTDYKSSLIRPVADRLSPVGPCFLNPSGFRHRVY